MGRERPQERYTTVGSMRGGAKLAEWGLAVARWLVSMRCEATVTQSSMHTSRAILSGACGGGKRWKKRAKKV